MASTRNPGDLKAAQWATKRSALPKAERRMIAAEGRDARFTCPRCGATRGMEPYKGPLFKCVGCGHELDTKRAFSGETAPAKKRDAYIMRAIHQGVDRKFALSDRESAEATVRRMAERGASKIAVYDPDGEVVALYTDNQGDPTPVRRQRIDVFVREFVSRMSSDEKRAHRKATREAEKDPQPPKPPKSEGEKVERKPRRSRQEIEKEKAEKAAEERRRAYVAAEKARADQIAAYNAAIKAERQKLSVLAAREAAVKAAEEARKRAEAERAARMAAEEARRNADIDRKLEIVREKLRREREGK